MGLLEIYLAGWILTATVSSTIQCKGIEQSRILMTKGECIALNSVVSAAWPVSVPYTAYQTMKDKLQENRTKNGKVN